MALADLRAPFAAACDFDTVRVGVTFGINILTLAALNSIQKAHHTFPFLGILFFGVPFFAINGVPFLEDNTDDEVPFLEDNTDDGVPFLEDNTDDGAPVLDDADNGVLVLEDDADDGVPVLEDDADDGVSVFVVADCTFILPSSFSCVLSTVSHNKFKVTTLNLPAF